jgi:Tol biopolymer transport system component
MRRWGACLAVILAAVAVAGLAGTASAQYFGQNKVQYKDYQWRSLTSDHFEVYYYTGLDSLAMRVLDLAEKTHATLSRRMGHTLEHRVPVILYGSHNDFAQTNVTPELIDAGTGGFTEALRNRVVLPFTGSYEELRHVVVHELVHAVMFDLLYGGNAASFIARQSFFSVPLWFAEGMAEYFSLGLESNAEMFLRDGALEGYLPPLEYSGGYIVYKQGQSAVSYLVDRFGEPRLRDVLQRIRQSRNFDRAFERSVGMPVSRFDEQWREWLRKRYWPTVAHKESPERFARRLTDHRKDESNRNVWPAVSPQGDRVAYVSDRRQYSEVFVMSAFDGAEARRLLRAESSVQFEAIPSLRGGLTWSPDGRRIALPAKSAGRDVLYVVDVATGRVARRVLLPCEALYYPAWSPTSDSVVVVGVADGRSDLWMVDVARGAATRLTDDTWDEKAPSWSPDGRSLVFSSDRAAPVVLHPELEPEGFGHYGLYAMDVASREVRPVLDTWGDDESPAWSPDGRRLAFISDRNGTPNLYLYTPEDSSVVQLTDVTGGIASLSWSRENDRLVFSAFDRGGFDVFTVTEPIGLDATLARLTRGRPEARIPVARMREPAEERIQLPPNLGALAGAWPDSVSAPPDTTGGAAARLALGAPPAQVDTIALDRPLPGEPPAWGEDRGLARHPLPVSRPDTSMTRAEPRTPLIERGGPFALADSVLAQRPSPYRVRLAPDYAGGGFYASSGFGFVGSTQIVFSDFLGNHNLFLATDVFSTSLDETNALAIYNYLPRRWDFGVGLFHFKDYFSSRVTSFGEFLGAPRLFSERTFGLLLNSSYPFDRYRRVEFNLTQMFLERTFFEEDAFGLLFETAQEFRSVTMPSFSLVGDNALFGWYGPVNGGRWNFTYSPALDVFPNALAYQTVTFDTRRYWDLTHGYTFAGRVLTGWSGGRDPQTFRVGGFSTLRGYSDFDLLGSRTLIVNAELRFPFIQQLGLVGPVPLGFFNLRGAVFGDAGMVWDEGDDLRLTHVLEGERRLKDPKVGFGVGVRTALGFVILKLDTAWSTDLVGVSQPRWHFSLGPEF